MQIGLKSRMILALLSLVGVVVMGYLLYLHYSPETSSFCDLGENLSCSGVNKSEYAKIAGIPMSALGLLYFLGIFVFSLKGLSRRLARTLMFGTVVLLGPSLYLSYIEFRVLENICLFCELSKLLMVAIIVTIHLSIRPDSIKGAAFGSALALAAMFAVLTFFVQSATSGPAEDYSAFAECLTDKGFKMYGSATCQFCARQRALFGDVAFERATEIECDPRNSESQTELCIAKNIEHTPTWIQEDASGGERYRFEPGVISLEELSSVSGCPLLPAELETVTGNGS